MKAVREVIRSDDGTVIGTLTGGTGPPLLLVHGGLLGLSRWSPLWERLATRFQVTALDRRGRGSSGDSPAYDVSREYQDVAAVARHVAQRAGCEVNVFGHSFGADCALGAAAGGAPMRRLALYEPPGPSTVPSQWRERLGQLIAADQPGAAVMSFLSDIIGLSPERIAALASQPGTADVLDIASRTLVREADAIAALDLPGLASNVDTPVLMLLGALSPSWAGEVTRTLSSALRGAELVIIPGHGHEGVDTAATEVADELARFFVDA